MKHKEAIIIKPFIVPNWLANIPINNEPKGPAPIAIDSAPIVLPRISGSEETMVNIVLFVCQLGFVCGFVKFATG